jgi:hypothetical protein
MSSNVQNEPYTEETFDQLPFKVLADNGDIIDSPTMIIVRTFPAGDANQQMGIKPSDISTPGEMSGNVFFVHTNSRAVPIVKFHTKDNYTRISFWIRSLTKNFPVAVLQFMKESKVVKTTAVFADITQGAVFCEIYATEFNKIKLISSDAPTHDFQIDNIRLYK